MAINAYLVLAKCVRKKNFNVQDIRGTVNVECIRLNHLYDINVYTFPPS